ncbi:MULTISPECIES: orotidine-5'-phosphate decarboxylase [Atopobiaceae]|jgi:orotidine-5'-phosphate decarboxylase|uniref:orotidine-5'-phosphate decarboxylase n=1 Tax=Atopobiaceae TaxID=1643824 RepID=UPI00034E3CA9|nr:MULTISPECIES: orotidine-5'-phosphate decarboxylase [Atopobiaceae]EPD78143.1 orotidine 5'-phosphate decarboxylase [Atopobium sp. oral taxon 199 str. F0494]
MLKNDACARDAIIVALDCDRERALELTDLLAGHATWVKVGMTLFYRYGPSIVTQMKNRGFNVFLDLKVHDIPFQIHGAACSAALSGADILSIHALGGASMISEGRAGAEEAVKLLGLDESRRTKLVAISVLTSMNEESLHSIGVAGGVPDEVARLARLSYDAGADGLVCSPQEASSMRTLLGPDALIITPGIRPLGCEKGDQQRVATPAAALDAGASKLVIGRPITAAVDPLAIFEEIVEELAN